MTSRYHEVYQAWKADPQAFWAEAARAIDWVKPWEKVFDPESTTFQRSEAWRIVRERDKLRWSQQWVPYEQISDNLKRAVIASEDDSDCSMAELRPPPGPASIKLVAPCISK